MARVGRREALAILGRAAGAVALGGAGIATAGCKSAAAFSCTDGKGLSAEDTAARAAMEYVDQARDPAKPCARCVQWVAAASDGCGGCKVLKGPIHPNGGCKLFAARG